MNKTGKLKQHRSFCILVSLLAQIGVDNFPAKTEINHDSLVAAIEHLELKSLWHDIWAVTGDTIDWLSEEGYIKLKSLEYVADNEEGFSAVFTMTEKWLQLLHFSFIEGAHDHAQIFRMKDEGLAIQADSPWGESPYLMVPAPLHSYLPQSWFDNARSDDN